MRDLSHHLYIQIIKKTGDGDSVELVKFLDLMSASDVNLTDKDIERLINYLFLQQQDQSQQFIKSEEERLLELKLLLKMITF